MSSSNKKTKHRVNPVEVFCRIRPLASADNENGNENCLKVLDDANIMIQIPECSSAFRNNQVKQLVYSFTEIFDDGASQKEIFEEVGLPLVQDLLAGKNGLLFTYGVTGSGKTYTMMGNQQDLGLLQRCLDTIFNSISFQQSGKYLFKPDKMNSFELQTEAEAMLERQKRDVLPYLNGNQNQNNNNNQYTHTPSIQDRIQKIKMNGMTCATPTNSRARADAERLADPSGKLVNIIDDHIYAVFISCIEIYNNYIYDLLDEFNGDTIKRIDTSKESKSLKEDAKGCMYIKDVTEIEVKSTEEALDLMHRAQRRRVVAYTDLNSESSRSHSIFTIRIVQAEFDPSSNDFNFKNRSQVHVSQLSLVDLAGSERTKRTKNTGSRLREAGSINSSLMALRNCIETLRENIISGTRKMVPYRDSKLTLLFKNYFEGNGKIKMILCLNPSSVEFDETINVLKFSDLVRDVLVQNNANDLISQRAYKTTTASFDAIEQANALLWANLASNNFALMQENFPPMEVYAPDDDLTLKRLVDYLEEFQRKRDATIHETDLIKQQFYMKIRELQDEVDKLREERNELRSRLESKEKEQSKFDSKIKALERVINTNNYVRGTPSSGQKENRFATPGGPANTQGTSTFSSSAFNANSGEKPTTTSNETPIASSYRSSRITTTTTTTQSIGRSVGLANTLVSTSNSNSAPPPLPPQTPTARFASVVTNSAYHSRYQSPLRSQQPPMPVIPTPARDGIQIANRRAQRRSKSVDLWLDHKPANTAKMDTVLQPRMQRKKSVSKLELSDTKKSSKYVLTHQEQDQDGEIITNLIKGDILRSPSGGANVVFTDIETLQVKAQEVGKARKRPSEEFVLEEKMAVEDRCSTAIEGHSRFKQINLKKVKI